MNEEKHPLGIFTGENIRKTLLENPDLPLVFAVDVDGFSGEYSSEYASIATAEIGEILDIQNVLGENDDRVFMDRDYLEEELGDRIAWDMEEGTPQDVIEAELQKQLAEYEPYWKKCIIVTVGN